MILGLFALRGASISFIDTRVSKEFSLWLDICLKKEKDSAGTVQSCIVCIKQHQENKRVNLLRNCSRHKEVWCLELMSSRY